MWSFEEREKGYYIVANTETGEEFYVITRMCAIMLSAKLNEYEIKLNKTIEFVN